MTQINSIDSLNWEYLQRARKIGLHCQVQGDGVYNAQIAFVGEAPGDKEVQMGKPFVGGSGKFMWSVASHYGITRTDVYASNVVKRQLVSLQGEDTPKLNKDELAHWSGLLRWELLQLPNLRYVVCLGNLALQAIVGEEGITAWRGSVVESEIKIYDPDQSREVTVVCCFNPAYAMRQPHLETVFKFDFAKLERVIDGTYNELAITPYINPSPLEAIEWCDRMQDEGYPVSFDIESITNETACVGFTNDTEYGMCINFRTRNDNRFSTSDERDVRLRIARLLADPNVRTVAQNGVFDSYWLWFKDRIRVHSVWFDTLLAHHLLYPGLPHSLGFLTSQYVDHPYYKDEKDEWREGGEIDSFWEYNVKDCCITLAAQFKLERELKRAGLFDFFQAHVMRLQPHLVRMTVNGTKCDVALKEGIAHDLGEEVARLRLQFQERAQQCVGTGDYHPNPDSPKQLGELFFRRLKLVGRGASTNDENRKRMYKHPRTRQCDRDMLDALNAYKKDKKFLSTYAEMQLDDDGRIRCEYKQFGVESAPGRLSSSKVLWGAGMNLQNQPKRAYPMFIADDGNCLFYFDLSQAEARVVARIARVQALLDNFELADTGEVDVHRANASRIFKMDYEDIPVEDRDKDGNPTKRFLGKRCVHGLNYRMGPDRLATTCEIPLFQAIEAYNAYHRAFPEIRRWWAKTERTFRSTKKLLTPYGRRLIALGRIDDSALESIVAFVPQSTVGDKVSSVIYLAESDHRWPDTARIRLNVHDALIGECKQSDAERCLEVIKEHAEAPIYIEGEPLSIPAELKLSKPDDSGIHRWSTLSDFELGVSNTKDYF